MRQKKLWELDFSAEPAESCPPSPRSDLTAEVYISAWTSAEPPVFRPQETLRVSAPQDKVLHMNKDSLIVTVKDGGYHRDGLSL